MNFSTKKRIVFVATGIALAVLFVLSFFVGKYPLSPREVFAVFFGGGTEAARHIVFSIRFPRTLTALLTGGALGLSGCVYQTLFDNPLASPDLIGVAGGANLGAAAMIVLGGGSALAVAVGSFVGAIGAVLCVMLLALLAGKGKISFLLGGIAVNAVSASLIMVLKVFADPENELASIEYWEMGSLGAVTWSKIAPAAILAVLAAVGVILFADAVTLLSLGDDECRALGVRLKPVRIAVLALNTLLVASVVSVTGLVSFVGLVAPHIAGLLLPRKGRPRTVLSAMIGCAVVTLADILARTVGKTELPISVLTAVTGIPVLIALLLGRRDPYGNDV